MQITGISFQQRGWDVLMNGKYASLDLLNCPFFVYCLNHYLFCSSYTWKIYANKLLNMGNIYSFWRQLNKEQKLAKQRYIQMFYNLQFRRLVCLSYLSWHVLPSCNTETWLITLELNFHLFLTWHFQAKNVPIPSEEVQQPVSKPTPKTQSTARQVT